VKLYNTFSQKKEEINLKDKIGIYVCGITPDGPTHLGHAFLFVVYDVLIRYLRFLGANVTYVQNVTDIDDDILIRSKAAGLTWEQMGDIQTKNHIKNMDDLNVARPDYYPKATENISRMIKIIQKLVDKKLAYVKNGSVYFSVSKDKDFGKLSKYGYPAMLEIANERGNFPLDPNKNDPLDFILWQARKPNEPFWESPWGEGRPGWHIECSTMSMRYLGKTVTVHGGGADLIFPHHEAEIAQSENYSGGEFVNVWMHVAMVYCSDKKMSKSLGNIIFVSELLKKHSPDTIRILLLSHHHRTPWNYQEEEFKDAVDIVKLLKTVSKPGALLLQQAKEELPAFFSALNDDFDTPLAIKILAKTAAGGNISSKKAQAISTASNILGLLL
jgi:L-cysteine:1D-myo-inositol 2-amino-2-deoxy-alpha-D-glucopyranoside ligase